MSLHKIRNVTFRQRVCNLVSILAEPQYHLNLFFYIMIATSRPGPPHCRDFTITFRHTTLGRTSLGEWPARRRDLYLTTHNTHNRTFIMLSAGFKPSIPASDGQQKDALDRASTGIGSTKSFCFTMGEQPPGGQRSPHYRGYKITLRHTTFGRTPLGEWSARRRDF